MCPESPSPEATLLVRGSAGSDQRELTHSVLTAALRERCCQYGCVSEEEAEDWSLGALLRVRILTSWSSDSQASDSHHASSLSKLLVNGLYIPWNISHRKQ